MKFTQLLTPNNIRQGIVCTSKKRILEMLGRIIGEQANIENFDELQCFESLFSREKLGNTAIGNGIAMPRARLPIGDKPIAVFLQLATPIDYDAQDHRHVDLIFAIMIPENICSNYTKVLSDLANKLTEKSLCKKLRTAQTEQEIWEIFEYTDHHYVEQPE